VDWRLFPRWQAGNDALLPAVRSQYAYPPGEGRATGWLLLRDREPVTSWPTVLAAQGPALLAALAELTGVQFSACCFQAYDGGTGCGWHADPEWAAQAILSLGVTRTFGIRRAGEDGGTFVKLAHGDLLVMPPGFQDAHEHCVPVEEAPGERVSLVFRSPL